MKKSTLGFGLSISTILVLGLLVFALLQSRKINTLTAELALNKAQKTLPSGSQLSSSAEARQTPIRGQNKNSQSNAVKPPELAAQSQREILRDSVAYPLIHRLRAQRIVQQEFGVLLNALDLPIDDIQKVKKLLVDKTLVAQDVVNLLREKGIPGSNMRSAAINNATADIDAEIVKLLGNQASTYTEFSQLRDAQRAISGSLTLDLSFIGEPLDAKQQLALAKIMAKHNYVPMPMIPIAPLNNSDSTSKLTNNFSAVMMEAASILSSAQLNALRDIQAEKEHMEAVYREQISPTKRP